MASKNFVINFDRYAIELGEFFVACSPRGICAIEFADRPAADFARSLAEQHPDATIVDLTQSDHGALDAAARAAFAGELDVASADVGGTDFQRQVWQALLQIPSGQTVSYAELAARIGRPDATRAVANAVARNRLACVIPCHRVVRKDGSTGGYRWGTDRKRSLLERERAAAQ